MVEADGLEASIDGAEVQLLALNFGEAFLRGNFLNSVLRILRLRRGG
jgi:hypothetical protein